MEILGEIDHEGNIGFACGGRGTAAMIRPRTHGLNDQAPNHVRIWEGDRSVEKTGQPQRKTLAVGMPVTPPPHGCVRERLTHKRQETVPGFWFTLAPGCLLKRLGPDQPCFLACSTQHLLNTRVLGLFRDKLVNYESSKTGG